MAAVRFVVSGRVQGVGFRQFVEGKARKLELDGWARNLDDGRVEVFAQGESEVIENLRCHLVAGPPSARVTSVESLPSESDDEARGFRIRS